MNLPATVVGDAGLYTAINAHIAELKDAFALTIELEKPIAALVGKTAATFSPLGSIGTSGAACALASASVAAEASVSINVSVQPGASVKSKAG